MNRQKNIKFRLALITMALGCFANGDKEAGYFWSILKTFSDATFVPFYGCYTANVKAEKEDATAAHSYFRKRWIQKG